MRPEVIHDKVQRAVCELAADENAAHVDDMFVHLQISGSDKGRAAGMYQRAVQAWAKKGGLLIFAITARTHTFDAVFVAAIDLLKRPREDTGDDVVRWILQQDDSTRGFVQRYIAYYTQVMLGERVVGQDAPVCKSLCDWVRYMEERAVMSARLSGVQGAHEVYKEIARLVREGPVFFPGLAPPPPPHMETSVRRVYSKDGVVWKKGVGANAVVLGPCHRGDASPPT